MALTGTTYDKKCPLFDRTNRSAGVLFPYFPGALGQSHLGGNVPYVNFDATAGSGAVHSRVKFPMTVMLVTCQAFACSDDVGVKAAAASTEPVISITYGTAPLASAAAGTEISTITCSGSGGIGDSWNGSTTETLITPTQELLIYLKTAAASATSANIDGGAVPMLWLAYINAP